MAVVSGGGRHLCWVAASSQMISCVCFMSVARGVLLSMLQVESPVRSSTGILKVEWAVLPPSRRRAAIPEEATARAILPWLRTRASRVLNRKVLPEPPMPSRKMVLSVVGLSAAFKRVRISSCTWRCSGFSSGNCWLYFCS